MTAVSVSKPSHGAPEAGCCVDGDPRSPGDEAEI